MFSGNISGLNTKTALFKSITQSDTIDKDEEQHLSMKSRAVGHTSESSATVVAPPSDVNNMSHETINPSSLNHSASDSKLALGSNMLAIESELEKDMALLKKKLEAKNYTVMELQHQLHESEEEKKNSKIEYKDCYKSLRLAEKRIE